MHRSNEKEIGTELWLELQGIKHMENLGIDGRILEWILEKLGGKLWTRFIWFWIGPMMGSCECGNGYLGSIQGRIFLDKLSDLIFQGGTTSSLTFLSAFHIVGYVGGISKLCETYICKRLTFSTHSCHSLNRPPT